MQQAIKTLPSDLSAAYSNVMKRIHKEGSETEALAVLSWINLAKRPLKIKELREALSVGEGQTNLDRRLLPHPQTLIDICQGLVVHRSDDVVQFPHFTGQEYLQANRSNMQLLADVDVARACITYLLFNDFQATIHTGDSFGAQIRTAVFDFGFDEYAIQHWHDHLREEGESDSSGQPLLFQLLAVEEPTESPKLLLPRQLLSTTSYYRLRIGRHFEAASQPGNPRLRRFGSPSIKNCRVWIRASCCCHFR